ncbi:MAG TPA: Tol-Pal system protein TolB, partial [Burkholderiaceae bacterium]|nr:Tol-Pal system protein TolB [Burkholderiaceae bacterium]
MVTPPEKLPAPSRRRWLVGALAAGALHGAHAQFRVEISGVGATQLPIAIAKFRDEDKSGQSISGIVRADLERSGVFRVVDSSGDLDETSRPDYTVWRGRGADALVAGSAARLSDV